MKHSLVLILIALLLLNQCGYRFKGRIRSIPPSIQTIAIPDFKNNTSRYQAEQFITFAIKEEFIKRSRLTLVETVENADSLLQGAITGFDVSPLSYSDQTAANLFQVRISVDVTFIDLKTHALIYEGKRIQFVDTYETSSGDFFSQETETLKKTAQKFASSIVSNILENF